MTRTGRIIIASTRAAAGIYDDRSGPMIAEWFVDQGFSNPGVVVVPDGNPVGRALRIAVADGVDVVITSGGTGISPTDETPAQTKPLLDFELPGLAEAIRRRFERHFDLDMVGRACRADIDLDDARAGEAAVLRWTHRNIVVVGNRRRNGRDDRHPVVPGEKAADEAGIDRRLMLEDQQRQAAQQEVGAKLRRQEHPNAPDRPAARA